MIKCYFVDVKSIGSTIPKSKFNKAEIERLADAIVAADGLLRPLILQQAGVEKYTVIEGHREYYAAVRAKEKDIKKAEMVNAFVIDANIHKSAIEQLNILTQSQSPIEILAPDSDTATLADLVAESIDRLLPEITAALVTQLQPIVSQLANHQQILDTIKSALVNKSKDDNKKPPETKETNQPVSKADLPVSEVELEKEVKPKSDRKKKSEPVEASGSDSPESKPPKATKAASRSSKRIKPADTSVSIPVAIEPQTQTIDTIPAIKTTKPVETKPAATGGSLESEKSVKALNLINTLSQDDLTLRMQRSAVLPAIIKLVPTIVLKRNIQLAQKFDTWEDLVNLKISGLTATKVQDIIKKLK